MAILPNQLFSSFPPFAHTLNLLFAGIGFEPGIKAFYIAMYLHLIFTFTSLLRWLITEPEIGGGNGRDKQYQTDLLALVKTELLAVPLMLFAGAWVLIHLLTSDVLAAFFFCGGVSAIIKEFDYLSARKLFNSALLLSFALWTQYSAFLYVILTIILWLSLSRWWLTRENWKQAGTLIGLSFLLWMPLLIRNAMQLGDPFYPALSGILQDSGWGPQQSANLERDLMGGAPRGFAEILLAPLRITFAPGSYGFGAEIGIVPLMSLALFPFARKLRVVNQIMIYVLFCYLGWLAVFGSFHYFLPPFLFLSLISYFSFRYLYLRDSRYLYAAWTICAIVSLLLLIRAYTQSFPLIGLQQTRAQYLRQNLDYYPIAEMLNSRPDEKVLLVGESRIAYFNRPVMAAGVYDRFPFEAQLVASRSLSDLLGQFRSAGIRYLVYNERGFARQYGQQGVAPLPDEKILMMKELIATSARQVIRSGDVVLYRIGGRDAW